MRYNIISYFIFLGIVLVFNINELKSQIFDTLRTNTLIQITKNHNSLQNNDSINNETIKNSFEKTELNLDYLKEYWYDTKAIAVSPFKTSKKKWIATGCIFIAASGVYFGIDQNLKNWSQEKRNLTSDKISQRLEHLGNGKIAIITVPIYLYGLAFKKPKAKRVALLSLESIIIAGLINQIPKYAFGRARPWSGESYNRWKPFNFSEIYTYNSFYSGHTTTIFALSTVIAEEYKHIKVVPPIIYTIAGITALSRVHDNAHWASDIFISAVISHYITKLIIKKNACSKNLSISPTLQFNNNIGISLYYKFSY